MPGGQGGVLRLIGAGILIAGGHNDTIIRNTVRHQGAYGIVLTPYPWLGRPASPSARCQGGRTFSVHHVPLCFFNAYGNLVADNHLSNNGWFANYTNADLADAAISGDPANCFARNASPNGAPTTYPPRLQRTAAECRSSGRDAAFFGPLGAQIACATQAFGPCTDGTVSATLATLEALAETLHAHTGVLSSPSLARTSARYPTLTAATAPTPPVQPTMPDPCVGVPANPWCPSN